MTQVTIIGATGSLGRQVTKTLLNETKAQLVLFSRSADRLADAPRVTKIAAHTSEQEKLEQAVSGSDLVFVALAGDLPTMAEQIITAMKNVETKRLVFISSYGIYGEIAAHPDESRGILRPYRRAADLVTTSGLDYTLLRPGWFDDLNDQTYHLVPKGETIYGHDISRQAIAAFVKKLVLDPTAYVKEDLGIVR